MKKLLISTFIFSLSAAFFFAQEAIKSIEDEYYDFLSLTGVVERPYLNYKTLSDSLWTYNDVTSMLENEDGTFTKVREPGNESDRNVWKNNNLSTRFRLWEADQAADNWFTRGIDQGLSLRIYGPEWYNSYNTAAPYGQNDGALWQGRGYNTSLTAGARLEAYGFELTFKPQLSFSQNMAFDLMDNSAYYSNKYAYTWGYGGDKGADAPQRFGDSAFWTFDWGDTEARWSWHSFTVGFGTQAIWLGPAWLNPTLHSNNAATYPKFDFGLRKTEIKIPHFGWSLGYIEARMWIGQTTESDYFDKDDSNNHNQITGMTFSYAPSFLPGLTLGVNKICMSKWDNDEYYKYLNPFYDVNNDEDQKLSLTADWLFPKVGLEIYGELGVDDYIQGWHSHSPVQSVIRNPFHTMTYSIGLKKTVTLSKKKDVYGEIIFEWNCTEMSQDFQFEWPYNFGFHHITTQGYTNKGQWIGSGTGYGGNSQILAFNTYYHKGNTLFFIWRNNPDNNYIYSKTISTTSADKETYYKNYVAYKANFNLGFNTNYYFTNYLSLQGGFAWNLIMNPHYNPYQKNKDTDMYGIPTNENNFHINLGIKYIF